MTIYNVKIYTQNKNRDIIEIGYVPLKTELLRKSAQEHITKYLTVILTERERPFIPVLSTLTPISG